VDSLSRSDRVGFIGVGDMGGAIVRRIVDDGWPTVLWARRVEALDEFDAPNVTIANSPAELAGKCDLIGVCVWSDDDVREVVTSVNGVLAGARAGTILAIHSTILPSTCCELSEAAAPSGVIVLDAPVTGGRNVALAGSLTVAVGGDELALARCRPVFESFAGTIVRVGAVGTGQFAKLLNNALFAANLTVADDALTLGAVLGLDASEFEQFLAHGSGRSYAVEIAARCRASVETRQAAVPALEKDLASLIAEAAAHSERSRLLNAAAAEAIRRLHDPPSGWQ
jgi:3-hydroxyisobutyrate dehydrogenase-like beta-hydroxyacid dehydrogenase